MSWSDYTAWRTEMSDIADATTYGTTLLMEKAPDGSDVYQYVATAAPMVLSTYSQAAHEAGLSYVRAAQRSAGLSAAIVAPSEATITWAVLEPVVKWALTDVALPWTMEQVLPRMVQGATRLVLGEGRRSVIDGAQQSGQTVTWRRVPRANACAYCRMMSQWQYSHQEDAKRTVTRSGYVWRDRHGRERWRAYDIPSAAKGSKQGAGSLFHGHCRCEPIAVFGEWEDAGIPEEIEDRWDTFSQQWDTSYGWAGGERTRQRDALWEEIQRRPLTASQKLDAFKRERKALPNMEQLALSQMRKKLSIR